LIRLEAISKIYSRDEVLKNINWEIKRGEKVGLVGSNGAGKTTQFRILVGEEDQTSGKVIKEGNPKIAYLKQEIDIKSTRTVREELGTAFKEIQNVYQNLRDIEKQMLKSANPLSSDQMQSLINMQGKYQMQFEALGGYQMDAEIDKILPKLGFSQNDAESLVKSFSGGWQMKIALGKIMLQNPDLLLLDEPTNHLDLNTILWLEKYLASQKIAIILISHDRYFLDKLCNKIIFIERGLSTTYIGNYSSFIEKRSLDELARQKAYLVQQKDLDKQKKYIEKFRASATRSTQAKSREKQIEKIQKIDSPLRKSVSTKFLFPDCPRSGKSIVEIKNLSHSIGNDILFFDSNLKVIAGDKIAFLGPNGCGKSTLFKIIMEDIIPELGEINLGKHNLIQSYYEQNQAEALELDREVIELVFVKAPNWSQEKARTFLGGFGFSEDSVFKKVENLSGGEKAKLALALMLIKPSNFLLLDEPTNHLDLQSKENLESALRKYKGTVLLISHDRYFISKIANKIVEIENCQINSFNGNYEYYLQKRKN